MRSRSKPLHWDRDVDGPRLVLTSSVVNTVERRIPLCSGGVLRENVLYIAGFILPTVRVGVTVIAPQCVTGPGFYRTDADDHADVMAALMACRLHIVAQVHCHPGRGVSHSEIDDEEAIVRADGHWSVVVPHYGLHGILPLTQCGIHCYTQGEFRRLDGRAIATRVSIIPDWIDMRGDER